jgi:hypothetical protein
MQEGNAESGRKRTQKWIVATAGAVLLAGLTAIASGLGSKAVDSLTAGDVELLSYTAEEQIVECGSVMYLPDPKAQTTLRGGLPTDWEAFQHQDDAALAESDVIQVSIQGESARAVTLTEIRFSATRQDRPDGAIFASGCGGPVTGRGVEADVESNPPRITASSDNPEGYVQAGGTPGSDTAPITFPWDVSLEDPLLLYVVATAESCYCVWKAEIPWVSGGEKGTITIDNEGRGYVVVGDSGLPGYTRGNNGWSRYQ